MPSVLFIPDRFMDYRMWGGVPDLIRDRTRVVHLDQCMPIPWPAPDEGFLDAVRGLAPREGFDVVAAAGQAARFGFAVASAGLGAGLMLFYPAAHTQPCALTEPPTRRSTNVGDAEVDA